MVYLSYFIDTLKKSQTTLSMLDQILTQHGITDVNSVRYNILPYPTTVNIIKYETVVDNDILSYLTALTVLDRIIFTYLILLSSIK